MSKPKTVYLVRFVSNTGVNPIYKFDTFDEAKRTYESIIRGYEKEAPKERLDEIQRLHAFVRIETEEVDEGKKPKYESSGILREHHF